MHKCLRQRARVSFSHNTSPASGPPSNAALLAVAGVLALLWGTAYTLIDVAVRDLEPVWLVSLRTLLGAGLVTVFIYLRGLRLPPIRDVRWLWYGVLGQTGITVPFILIATAQERVESGLTGVIVATTPVLTVALAHVYGSERVSAVGFLGFVVAFAGIAVLFLPEDLSLSLVAEWRSQVLLLLSACFYAFTTVAATRVPETPPETGAAVMLISAAVSATVAGLVLGLPAGEITGREWVLIAALGVGSTALGTILYVWAAARAGAGYVAKVNYLAPPVSVVSGALFLGEVITWRLLVAVALVILGLWITRSSRLSEPQTG